MVTITDILSCVGYELCTFVYYCIIFTSVVLVDVYRLIIVLAASLEPGSPAVHLVHHVRVILQLAQKQTLPTTKHPTQQ